MQLGGREGTDAAMRLVMLAAKVIVLLVGLAAIAHFASTKYNRPLLFIAEVRGKSMEPTLQAGERILCVRAPWQPGDVVLADVGEDSLVVKRVAEHRDQWVYLVGDNHQTSRTYWVSPQQIKSVMLCRLALPSPLNTRAVAKSPDGP